MKEIQLCDILIKDTSYLTEEFKVKKHQNIAINNGRIEAIYPFSGSEEKRYTGKEELDSRDRLWMPGLIDGHMHTGQQLLKGAVLDELPMIWTRIMLPFESTLTPEKMELSANLAALEMIKNGTTGFVDAGSYFMEIAAEVYIKSGLRGALSCSAMDKGNFPFSIQQTTEEVLETEDELHEICKDRGNLKVFYALRALMNCSQELIERSAEKAQERGTFLQAHMNEYPGEVNYTLEKYKLRPVEYLESLGVLKENFVAAHSILLSPGEKRLLGERKAKVVHCPFSNCGKGVPETPDLVERGIFIGLGTDGTAHGGLSLWNEMKIFRSVMNSTWGSRNADPEVMPAETILNMVTQGGASILGEEGALGVLKPGYRADLISVNWNQPHLVATSNRVHTLLECVTGGDIADSIVEGQILMKNRQVLTLDEEKILWQAVRYFEKGEISL